MNEKFRKILSLGGGAGGIAALLKSSAPTGMPLAPTDQQYTASGNSWAPAVEGQLVSTDLTLTGAEAAIDFTLVGSVSRTINLAPTASTPANYILGITNGGSRDNVLWSIVPDGVETINAASSFILPSGDSGILVVNAPGDYTFIAGAADISSLPNRAAPIATDILKLQDSVTRFLYEVSLSTLKSFINTGVQPLGFTLHFDANDALFPSSNPAAASSRNAHPIIAFDDTTAENIIFNNTIPNRQHTETHTN